MGARIRGMTRVAVQKYRLLHVVGGSGCAKIPEIARGRSKTTGLIHLGNTKIDSGCPNSKTNITNRGRTTSFYSSHCFVALKVPLA